MKKPHRFESLLTLSLLLAACSTAPVTREPDALAAVTNTQAPTAAADTATEASTATETPPANLIHLGNLDLVPFTPPWFEGDMETTVFLENDLLRIDSPQEALEPGKNQVTGVVTLANYEAFDISATFTYEGGAYCRDIISRYGLDYIKNGFCGNIFVSNCIIFDFIDFDNMQKFCIDGSAVFWNLVTFENGGVAYDSSVQFSDAIHDVGVGVQGEHPIPNELRLILQDNLLTGYINGTQVLERDRSEINGQIGVGCVNTSMDPQLSGANCEIKLVVNP